MLDRLRHAALTAWANLVCHRAAWVLAVGLLLAAAALIYTKTQLSFQSDRNELISSDLPWNRRYIDYRKAFAGQDTIVIAVKVPDRPDGMAEAQRFVDTLGPRLQQQHEIVQARWFVDPATTSPKLLRLAPMPRFKTHLAELAQSGPLLSAKDIADLIQAITAGLNSNQNAPDAAEHALDQIKMLVGLINTINSAAKGKFDQSQLNQLSTGSEPREYLVTDDAKLLFVEIQARYNEGEIDLFGPAVRAARTVLQQTLAEFHGSETPTVGKTQRLEAGISGLPVMEADETKMSTDDTERASIFSMILLAVLLVYAFRSIKLPLLMVASLLVGIAWAFGYVTLAVGHLQVLSVVFTILLLGLGIDYGIHIVSRFELIRHEYPEGALGYTQAMTNALLVSGPGVITGAITTAAAFSTTMFTDFTGMAEMGKISCVGVLLCLVAMLGVLPAAMRFVSKKTHHVSPVAERRWDFHDVRWLMPLSRNPWITLAIAAVVTAVCAVGMARVRYDNNLLNLLPDRLNSVQWINEINRHEASVWSGVFVVDSLDKAREMTRKLEQSGVVESVGGAGRLFPRDEQEKLTLIRDTRQKLGPQLEAPIDATKPPSVTELKGRLGALRLALTIAVMRPDVKKEVEIHKALQQLLAAVVDTLVSMDTQEFDNDSKARLSALHRGFQQWQADTVQKIRQALDTSDFKVEELPEALREEVASVHGPQRYQLKAYPKGDVWDPARLAVFIGKLRQVDPNVTGSPVQIHESGLLMQHSYEIAGLTAFIVVFILVFLDFWNIIDAILSVVPVSVAFVITFGLMYLCDVSINPANIIVMPLMFGIGVASGVNMMHRYKQNPHDHPTGLTQGTGKGIILTNTATVIAFATMLLAQHKGIQSLGFVLTAGITATLLACLVVMPPLLELRNRINRRRAAASQT